MGMPWEETVDFVAVFRAPSRAKIRRQDDRLEILNFPSPLGASPTHVDVSEVRRIVKGMIVGTGPLPPDIQMHPYLEWTSEPELRLDDQTDRISISGNETFTVRFPGDLAFKVEGFELWGPKGDESQLSLQHDRRSTAKL